MRRRFRKAAESDEAKVALLAPSPILTVTLEHDGSEPELHLHAGGQGYWVARMLRGLGIGVAFCAPLGGEVGTVLRALLVAEGLGLHAVESGGWNGAYVHDRGRGDPVSIGETRSPALSRHWTSSTWQGRSSFDPLVPRSPVAGSAPRVGPLHQ